MPPKAKIAAPIDRPLSRAYLREFSGWSTAYPPGLSEPTSLREMENMLVNRDGSLRTRPGLRYLSYSQAPGDRVPVPQVTPIIVGSRSVSAGYSAPITSIALPAGTQIGDLIVIALLGGNGSSVACDDPRMEVMNADPLASTGGVYQSTGGRPSGVWVGYATTLDPVSIYLIATYGAVSQFSIGSVTVFRGSEGPLEWVPSKVVATASSTSTTAMLPGMNGDEISGAMLVYFSSGGVGGTYGDQTWGKAPAWSVVSEYNDAYVEIDVAHSDTVPVPAQTTPNNDTHSTWKAVVLAYQGDSSLSVGAEATGIGSTRPLVGTHEPFYLNDGTKAYLLAVREEDETVGFRVLVVDVNDSTMYELTHPLVDFEVLQPTTVLNFSSETTYVKYLQIDNKIFALSDNGEPMRVFHVGARKMAKALAEITRPEWDPDDKLGIIEPDATWINDRSPIAQRRNRLHNPSFETNGRDWNPGPTTDKSRPQSPAVAPVSGSRVLRLTSLPQRTNLAASPLYDVVTTGIDGWTPGTGDPVVEPDTSWLKVTMPAAVGSYFARSRQLPGVEAGTKYQVAFDYDEGAHVAMQCKIRFFGVNGAQVGKTVVHELTGAGRFSSPGMIAPKGAVTVRISVGGDNNQADTTNVRIKNVVFCPADEPTSMFHGGSGTNYFWTGTTNRSASVYHPPAEVQLTSDVAWAAAGKALVGSMYVAAGSTARNATLRLRMLNKDHELLDTASVTTLETVGTLVRMEVGDAAIPAKATRAELRIVIPDVAHGEYHYVDAAMIETGVSVAGPYFDGSTSNTPTKKYSWRYGKHESVSVEKEYATAPGLPTSVAYTADTLHATGGAAANPYNFAFFYTFNNEVGESAASQITLRRMQRAWSEWAWETPNAAGEPSGTSTTDPLKCADQLVAYMPVDVYDEALAEGAISWSLYMFTWSNQDPVPVVAVKIDTRELLPDSPYDECGWIRVTPSQADITDDAILPSLTNRINYSNPSRAGQGIVAADRLILVNDPADAGVIRWSSNLMGENTNFTASKGGGYKTLSSGNLYVPACVKLWQNPQSADTLTILCLGTDGQSAAYYMAPAQVTSQSDATSFMGFEETTATQGTTSPYGVEVFNNALYHPLDDQLVKSTASNYNISHKSMTDQIANVWADLATKYWIMSSQHENRLYYLVNNPAGAPLEDACKGNEIWVYDALGDTGTWSRFLVQAHALRKIEFGNRIYMSVIRPDGVYYLDPEYALDDHVGTDLIIGNGPIDWKFETNTQGANRAHDAWAHLQQVSLGLGSWQGPMRYGVKGWDVHGRPIDKSKVFRDDGAPSADGLPWDIEDFLLVERDMKEWQLYASSIPGEPSSGQFSLVQYRYAPVSVNVGYEHGSVETFEYARNVAVGATRVSTNGIPVPAIDTRRP